MKRTLTFAAFAVAAFATGFAATSAVKAHAQKSVMVALGEACTTVWGHSGYMVSTGDKEVCQETSGS